MCCAQVADICKELVSNEYAARVEFFVIRALVTGGTGFIGSHLVDALLSREVKVRCLVRSKQNLRWLNGKDVELIEGDCIVNDTLDAAVRDMDMVFHAAGALWAARAGDFFLHNVQGTKNLLNACKRSCPGLRRFVQVSSQAAAGPSSAGKLRSESDPPDPITPYGASKLEAEKAVLAYKGYFPVVILRPCAVYGPRDTGFLAYFRVVRRGFLVEFGTGEDRTASLCHVSDVVRGMIDAADSQVASGSVYFLANSEPYSWREVERVLERLMGVEAKRLKVPAWILILLGTLGQVYGRITGKSVMLNRARVGELMARHWGCDASRARREFDFTPEINLNDGLLDVIRWYKKEQWL